MSWDEHGAIHLEVYNVSYVGKSCVFIDQWAAALLRPNPTRWAYRALQPCARRLTALDRRIAHKRACSQLTNSYVSFFVPFMPPFFHSVRPDEA